MRMSKGLYLGVMAAGLIGGIVFIFVGMGTLIAAAAKAQGSQDPTAMVNAIMAGGIGVFALAVLCFLVFGVTYLVLIFKAWSAIQDGQASWSPAVATIPLIVPLLNLIWVFIGIWGWAKDYNKYVTRHNLNVPKVTEGLFLGQAICVVLGLIPIVNAFAGLANLILTFVNAAKMCDSVNALQGAKPAMAAGAAAGR